MAIGLCIAFLNCLGSGFLICGINEVNIQLTEIDLNDFFLIIVLLE